MYVNQKSAFEIRVEKLKIMSLNDFLYSVFLLSPKLLFRAILPEIAFLLFILKTIILLRTSQQVGHKEGIGTAREAIKSGNFLWKS